MARVIDVIEYPNEIAEEIVHRFPEGGGAADYRLGSQVIVRESQRVVFFREGAALDVFETEPYTTQENRDLRTLPNVVMTPHLGASSKENLLRIGEIIESIIEDWNKRS